MNNSIDRASTSATDKPRFSGEWASAALGKVCEILNGYAFKSKKYVDDGIRVIRIANVQKGYLEDSHPCFYPASEEESIAQFLLHENDLLLSLTGNVGRVALLDKSFLPAALNQRVACLRIKDESRLNKRYLFHCLNSMCFENECIESANGIAQKNLSTVWLKSHAIPVPQIDRQLEIAGQLDLIHAQIDRARALLEKLDDLVKSRFIEMFGDPNDLCPLTFIEDGFSIRDDLRKPLSGAERSDMHDGELYPYYGANGVVDYINSYLTDFNALCLAEDCGSYGAGESSAYVIEGKGWVNNHAHLLKPKQDCLLEYAETYFCLLDLNRLISGTTRAKLTQSQLKQIRFEIPPLELCRHFTAYYCRIDKLRFMLLMTLRLYIAAVHFVAQQKVITVGLF